MILKRENRSFVRRVIYLCVLTVGCIISINSAAIAQPADTLTYTVQPGDSLRSIAQFMGDSSFAQAILRANRKKVGEDGQFSPGQVLAIPKSVVESDNFVPPTRKDIAIDPDAPPPSGYENREEQADSLKRLENELRIVLENLRQSEEKKQSDINYQQRQNGLEFGGLIINRTKSKMGRDFFNEFYDNWTPPEEAGNFMLEITEQPVPSMGTIILIKIDNEAFYKTKLQPRQELIQQMSQEAVAVALQYLENRSSTQQTIY